MMHRSARRVSRSLHWVKKASSMKIFRSKRGRQNRPPRRRRETSAATCSCMPPSRHCPLRARRLRSRPSLERIRDRLPQWVWANHPPQRRRTMTTRREKVDPCIRSRPFRAGHLPPHLRAVASRLPKMRIKKIPTSASAFPCTLMRALCRHHRRHHVPPLSRVCCCVGAQGQLMQSRQALQIPQMPARSRLPR